MQSILDKLAEWLKELLISGILGNLSGMFDTVNTKVGEIAGEVGMTPSAWNGGVFNLIRSLSETVIIPIAGIILTFVMCYELIQLVIEKNNLHDVDTWIFFKWMQRKSPLPLQRLDCRSLPRRICISLMIMSRMYQGLGWLSPCTPMWMIWQCWHRNFPICPTMNLTS